MDGNELQKLEIRVRQIETDRRMTAALDEERNKTRTKEWDELKHRIGKIELMVNRAIGLLVLAIFSAFINFVLQGGLNIAN